MMYKIKIHFLHLVLYLLSFDVICKVVCLDNRLDLVFFEAPAKTSV